METKIEPRNFFAPLMGSVDLDDCKISTHSWKHKWTASAAYVLGVIESSGGYSLVVYIKKGVATNNAARVCNNMLEPYRELDSKEKQSLDKIRKGFEEKTTTLVGGG